jgi:hypothetical protein
MLEKGESNFSGSGQLLVIEANTIPTYTFDAGPMHLYPSKSFGAEGPCGRIKKEETENRKRKEKSWECG